MERRDCDLRGDYRWCNSSAYFVEVAEISLGQTARYLRTGARPWTGHRALGNFVDQEAFGNIVTDPNLQFFPYAVYIQERFTGTEWVIDQWVQATFFYESMWDIGVMVLLLVYARRAKHDGNVFAMYLIGYGIGRFWIEGIRISTLQTGFGMPVSQFLSLILVIIGIVYILVMRKRNKPDVLYEGRYCKDFKKAEA